MTGIVAIRQLGGVLVIFLLLTNQLTELKGRKAYND